MSRASRGCLRCRSRRVKCDEGRPSCRRCVQRDEVCEGYRDEASLVFRNENEKAANRSIRRHALNEITSGSNRSSQASSVFTPSNSTSSDSTTSISSSPHTHGISDPDDPSDLGAAELCSLKLSTPYPWTKNVSTALVPSAEDQAASRFFEEYVMYPCNNGSSPGFLEHLPALFKEGETKGRVALRLAVRAASYGSLSNEQNIAALGNKALQCYGLALTALGESLADHDTAPDDSMLMTIVILDLFEALHLGDQGSRGSHAGGMAQILRLRGTDQVYGSRGWSLFRLSHHRLQRQQLAFKQAPLPESETWLASLNDELPYVRIEKQNFQISKICERARELLKKMDEINLPLDQTVDMIKEMHALDQAATTWRDGPCWAYKTVHRSQLATDEETASNFPEFIQLHHDVWIAYEWNYHRTARIIMHEHLLECLDRLHNICSGTQAGLRPVLCSMEETSIATIKDLADEVLSTVPQSFGDIDHEGNLLDKSSPTRKCKGIGGYFLLWPIRVVKATRSVTTEQRMVAEGVFERIREYTGMKSVLGESSKI